MREVITLAVFAAFSYFYLHELLGWSHAVGFTPIALGSCSCFSAGRRRRNPAQKLLLGVQRIHWRLSCALPIAERF